MIGGRHFAAVRGRLSGTFFSGSVPPPCLPSQRRLFCFDATAAGEKTKGRGNANNDTSIFHDYSVRNCSLNCSTALSRRCLSPP